MIGEKLTLTKINIKKSDNKQQQQKKTPHTHIYVHMYTHKNTLNDQAIEI